MSAPRTLPWPLVALFTAGYLAPYLLPTTVGRLDSGLPLTATQAGAIGSALLLSSATAGFLLASRADRFGPRALARTGLALAAAGYGGAALTAAVPAVVVGAVIGGFGSGTVTAVAASGIAALGAPAARTQPRAWDPHRVTTLGLLGVSALAGALYLTIPRLGPGHGQPLAAVALTALAVWPLTGRLPGRTAPARPTAGRGRLPRPRAGLLLTAALPFWSLAQNSLWGVSGRIGLDQARLSEVTVGAVFAVALGAGLVGVVGAGALGQRLGQAVPIGAGTALIAVCIALSASARDLPAFAAGEISWNLLYPVVLSYVIGLAASLDPRGRWAVLVGSASSLGTAAGPLTGSVLAAGTGFPVMGRLLGAGLLLVAVPMTAVALRAGRRTPHGEIPVVDIPVVEIPVLEIPVLEIPVLEIPVLEIPVRETPVVEIPVRETPVVETPVVEIPVVEIPLAGVPAPQAPAVEIPVVEVALGTPAVPAQRAYDTASANT